MKSDNKRAFSIVAIVLLAVTIIVGTIVYVCLPKVVNLYVNVADLSVRQFVIDTITPVLYIVGIPVLAMLVFALLMMINIAKEKAFYRKNVIYMRLMALCSLVIALVFIYPMFVMNSVYPIVLFVMFLLITVIILVFAEVFRAAIRIKKENELTI